jgi:SAM-dependent methyltransferase
MSYKVLLWDSLSPIEWSQASWRKEGRQVPLEECDEELIRDVLLRHLPRDGVTVDAGCGSGKWPIYLRRRGYRVVGLEIDHAGCAIAAENEPGLAMAQCDVRRIPLRDASVDAVISLGVVEHDEAGPDAALAEARRILKPGGTLILAVPFNNLWRRLVGNRLLDRVTRQRLAAGQRLGFNEYRFSRREVYAHLAGAGFTPLAAYPNELRPPKNMGLWVDWNNLMFSPLQPRTGELFVFPGLAGRLANALQRWTPWLVCGEVVVVARAGC